VFVGHQPITLRDQRRGQVIEEELLADRRGGEPDAGLESGIETGIFGTKPSLPDALLQTSLLVLKDASEPQVQGCLNWRVKAPLRKRAVESLGATIARRSLSRWILGARKKRRPDGFGAGFEVVPIG
jgi:hypothetical protein